MTFLNAALLGGILALGIPIIIHLLHKSRFEVVRWGAMHLLETVIRTNQRRIRLEQIILLLLRCCIPLFLALLMARPVWRGAQSLLGDAKSSTVVLLDNSYSMQASRAGVTTFSIAQEETGRIIGDLKRGSEAQVVLMGEGGAPLLDQPTYDMARITQAVNQLTAAYGMAEVPSALNFAAGLLEQMHEPARNLVVLTDFQRVSFDPTADKLLAQSLDRLRKMPLAPSIAFFDVGQDVRDNVAVESMDFSKLMIGVRQKFQVRGNIRNYGDANYPELRVYFKVDGKERSVSQVKLGPHQTAQVLFSNAFDTAGSHVVEIYADADPLKADNSYLASVTVRDRIPVLLVNGDPSPEPLKGETDFAEIALQPFGAARSEITDLITTQVIKADALNPKTLSSAAMVLLANVRSLNDAQLRDLEEFVKNGGGLLIFPGNRVDPTWYNGPFFKDGKGLLPASLGAIAGSLEATSTPVSIVAERFENPALEIFNDPRNGRLSEAAIKVWFRLQEPGKSAGSASTLARLDTGDPFLVEQQFGEGRVILASTAVDADWSNLPMRSFYLPLLQRLSVYLASTVYPPRNLDVGKPIVAFLPAADAGKKASLTLPDGTATEIPVVKRGSRGVAEFARTQQPGLYTVVPASGQPLHYVVNASRRESDLQKLNPNEIADFAKQHDVPVVRSASEYQKLEHARRYGHEIWKPLLWALLLLCFGELFLQQRFAGLRGSRTLRPVAPRVPAPTRTA